MKEIQLGVGQVALVDDADYPGLVTRSWRYQRATYKGKAYAGYAVSRGELMHRVVLAAPKGIQVDHIDGNSLNNQRGNLRLCTPSQNLANKRRIASKSGFKGVLIEPSKPKPYRARITFGKQRWSLGHFSTAVEAAAAYDKAAIEIFGSFAATNQVLGRLP